MDDASSSSLPLFAVFNSLKPRKFPFLLLVIFPIFIFTPSASSSIPPDFSAIPYSQYCNDIVPQSPLTDAQLPPDSKFLRLNTAVFGRNGANNGFWNTGPLSSPPRSVQFRTRKVYRTESDGVFKVSGVLNLHGSEVLGFFRNSTRHRRLSLVHVRPPRIPVGSNTATFRLYGFWSSDSGKLCMVGSGVSSLRSVNVILKLNYPKVSTIFTSVIDGTLQSFESPGAFAYFNPISIIGVSLMPYNYSLINKENNNGGFHEFGGMPDSSLPLPSSHVVCSMMRSVGRFELENGDDCKHDSCSYSGAGGENVARFMVLLEIECLENGKVRYLVKFSNFSHNGFQLLFNPSTALVSEGVWDEKKKQLNLVACPMSLDSGVSFVGDCSIKLSLSFASTFSLRNRSSVVGKIWSSRTNNSTHAGTTGFRSSAIVNSRLIGLKYAYTQNEIVRKLCSQRLKLKGMEGTYPDGNSQEMRFDMVVRDKKGQTAWGYSSPLFVGQKFYAYIPTSSNEDTYSFRVNSSFSGDTNISYVMSFRKPADFELSSEIPEMKTVEIAAEGSYDSKTGIVCMVGCRHLSYENFQNSRSLDCEIFINIQCSLRNGKNRGQVKGTIESMRNKSDPLYFYPLEFSSSSISAVQAKESIWRMDLEITVVLISNTLSCIFVGLQLNYLKRKPDLLPFISVVMLVVLTLAHMLPLLLNFEALFLPNNKQNLLLGKQGWIEVNEVLVRIITMVAFLLEVRLLQLTWSARNGEETQKTHLWVFDKKVLYLFLPLYIGGGLLAWVAHLWKVSYLKRHHKSMLISSHRFEYQNLSFWGELKSCAGLVLDGFLLPQILFNFFSDSRERALSLPFYTGTTLVRLLPHAYDLYQAHRSMWFYRRIYADPKMDYYSTTWDLVISWVGLLCVFVIYVQQRFGGRCFLPKRFRANGVYEKVAADGS